jgi:thiol-disulfide isomerase/thioredoxin
MAKPWQSAHHCSCRALTVTTRAGLLGKDASKDPWWNKDCPENLRHIKNIQHLVDELAAAPDRLVIVEFFAPWCAACKGLFPKMCNVLRDNPDILLLGVNFDENKAMAKALEVKSLPTLQFYRGSEGKVEQFTCSAGKIQKLM